MLNKKQKTLEIILYVLFGLIALGGLTLIVLDFVGMSLSNVNNVIRVANNNFARTMKMTFLVFGSLLLVLSAVASAITLAVNGQKAELIEEKKARRRQRMELEDTTAELE
ncbi:MAG: hypothetical protein RBS24_05430 [Bacilli bacterium]|nr:hypothetical protein [Bacilli bacterium]